MAVPADIIKIDNGSCYFVSKCFPARNIFGGSDDAGAWLVAHRLEQKKQLKAVLVAQKSKTYCEIKHDRKLQDKDEKSPDGVTPGLFDGFFLLKHCCVDDPSDLCSINVAGHDLTDSREDDFDLFYNVVYVNAGENMLSFESFSRFTSLRELEIPLNGLRGLKITFKDFLCLEILDLSYNNLSKDDLLILGVLPKLTMLYLSGNQLRSLPVDMQKPHILHTSDSQTGAMMMPRFALLEVLHLDDNQLSGLTTFASLAGLRRLKKLNLEKNNIQVVPHLKATSGKHVAIENRINTTSSTPRSGKYKSAKIRYSTPDGTSSKNRVDLLKSEVVVEHITETIEKESSSDADILSEEETPEDLPPPFPELEYLSLAHNKIVYEEDLLAVAAWPMLNELNIHDNPLTIHNSGDPPLLKQCLVNRLGIKMTRQRPTSATKPTIQVTQSPNRKVAEIVRPLPKRPIQLMLEGTPNTSGAFLPMEHVPNLSPVRPASQPLPPISCSPESYPFRLRTEDQLGSPSDRREMRPKTCGDVEAEEAAKSQEQSRAKKKEDVDEQPVFLTQVDDQEEELSKTPHPTQPSPSQGEQKQPIDSAKYSFSIPDNFKGYEVFWNAPNDEEVTVQKDIQGNLRALKLALGHKPVFRSDVDLDRLQKPFEPHQKKRLQPRPPHKTKAEKLDKVLTEIKTRITVTEENLGIILEDKQRMRDEYPEVPALLKQIQTKYKVVREESLKEKRELEKTKVELLNSIQDTKSSIYTSAPQSVTR